MSEPRKVYTVQEVAQIFRVSPATIRRQIQIKQIKAIRMGDWRISEAEVKRLLGEKE